MAYLCGGVKLALPEIEKLSSRSESPNLAFGATGLLRSGLGGARTVDWINDFGGEIGFFSFWLV